MPEQNYWDAAADDYGDEIADAILREKEMRDAEWDERADAYIDDLVDQFMDCQNDVEDYDRHEEDEGDYQEREWSREKMDGPSEIPFNTVADEYPEDSEAFQEDPDSFLEDYQVWNDPDPFADE